MAANRQHGARRRPIFADPVPEQCRQAAFNCVPRCGKWPGDGVDIGAWEYVLGITAEKPWGDWDGVPFKYAPGEEPPERPNIFRKANKPPPPFDLKITESATGPLIKDGKIVE